jgi:hypothetical protein
MMDFFQGQVEDYLRADRASFNNPEFYLQRSKVYETGKTNWYVDVLNVNFRDKTVYLCEVTIARNPTALCKRLQAWKDNWDVVIAAVHRDANVPQDWKVRVWVFCPDERLDRVLPLIPAFDPVARVTNLEIILPWKYNDHDRIGEKVELKSPKIPDEMRN